MMKKLFWKLKYARYLKKKLGLTILQGLRNADSMLEMIDYDYSEDPEEMAQEDVYCWASDCV